MSKPIQIILIIIGGILTIALTAVALLYLWPNRSGSLQKVSIAPVSYEQALTAVSTINMQEDSEAVTTECKTSLKTHGSKTAKTVVMLHGITACPKQFAVLGQKFYEAGYNVYIPRAPHHGTDDPRKHAAVRATELVDYVNSSLNIARGLGGELGVAGLSGGGMLATWAAEYHPDIQHALILSPFYKPAPSQAPKWQLPLLKKLHGFHILPDQYSDADTPDKPGFSYRALANYLIVTENLRSEPDNLALKSIGLVTSGSDRDIDHSLAEQIPRKIAGANNLPLHFVTLPEQWDAGHDIVDPDKSVGLREHQEQLIKLYFNLYEGRDVSL